MLFKQHLIVVVESDSMLFSSCKKLVIIIIIIKQVLIKVTLSCQRHCRGTAQSLTSKKKVV